MYVRPCDYQCLWGKVLMKLEGKCNVVCALYSCRLLSECTYLVRNFCCIREFGKLTFDAFIDVSFIYIG